MALVTDTSSSYSNHVTAVADMRKQEEGVKLQWVGVLFWFRGLQSVHLSV